ncbi:MAG: hypothetical protein IIW13_06495 [Paludibacteraceae bacterium]|nr:hypothetical protein [Paludibacteraceae bacterium]
MKKFILSVAILLPIMFSFTSCEPGEDDFNCYRIEATYKFINIDKEYNWDDESDYEYEIEYLGPKIRTETIYVWNTPRGVKTYVENSKKNLKANGCYDIKIEKEKLNESPEGCAGKTNWVEFDL